MQGTPRLESSAQAPAEPMLAPPPRAPDPPVVDRVPSAAVGTPHLAARATKSRTFHARARPHASTADDIVLPPIPPVNVAPPPSNVGGNPYDEPIQRDAPSDDSLFDGRK